MRRTHRVLSVYQPGHRVRSSHACYAHHANSFTVLRRHLTLSLRLSTYLRGRIFRKFLGCSLRSAVVLSLVRTSPPTWPSTITCGRLFNASETGSSKVCIRRCIALAGSNERELVANVPDAETQYHAHEFLDATVQPKPIYISPNEVYAMHGLLSQHLDDLVRQYFNFCLVTT